MLRFYGLDPESLANDELGFQAMTREDGHLLFKVVSYRY